MNFKRNEIKLYCMNRFIEYHFVSRSTCMAKMRFVLIIYSQQRGMVYKNRSFLSAHILKEASKIEKWLEPALLT